jgi:hypothetical protein
VPVAAIVKGFGCRPMTDGAANSAAGGRRTKASKERNRGKGYEMGCGARYGELSATRDSEAGWFSTAVDLEGLCNFGDMARVLLNGEKGFSAPCDFKELRVAKRAHRTTST